MQYCEFAPARPSRTPWQVQVPLSRRIRFWRKASYRNHNAKPPNNKGSVRDTSLKGGSAAAGGLFRGVQSALGLLKATPSSGTFVLPEHYGACAGPAADAWVALIVERIVGNILVGDELPDFFLRPIRQRA